MPDDTLAPSLLQGPLDALPDPVLVLDRGWRVRAVNAAAQAMFEARPGDADGDGVTVLDLLPLRQAAVVERCLHEAEATGRVCRHSVRDVDAEPGVAHVGSVTVMPLGDQVLAILHLADGRPVLPEEQEAAYGAHVTQALIEAGISLAAEQSLDRLLQQVVDVARELTGSRYAALGVVNAAGTGLSDFITSGLTPAQRARMGELPTGHGILGMLVRDARPIRLHDLNEHPVSAGVPAHHPAMRSFMGVPVVTRGRVFGNLYLTEKAGGTDFTDADLTLARLLAAQAAVAIDNAELRRDRDRFFAAASHELGNAMAGVTLWARLLVRQPPTEQAVWQRGVRNILGAAEQTARLVEDLLSVSRLREGRLTLDPGEVVLREIGEDAIELLRPESEAAGVTLVLAGGATGRAVTSDRTRVRQILVNLLGNAIKFSPAGGTITLAVADDDADDAPEGIAPGGVLASVVDQGPGVPEEARDRIFRPYEQIAAVARGRGTGLGLHLSRQLARLMGGDLQVDDAPGGGARFTLRLPAVVPAVSELPYDRR